MFLQINDRSHLFEYQRINMDFGFFSAGEKDQQLSIALLSQSLD